MCMESMTVIKIVQNVRQLAQCFQTSAYTHDAHMHTQVPNTTPKTPNRPPHAHTHARIHMHTNTHTHTNVHKYAHIQTHTQMYTHTHVHMDTHTCTCTYTVHLTLNNIHSTVIQFMTLIIVKIYNDKAISCEV